MRQDLWRGMTVWAEEKKHGAGSWIGTDEEEHRIVYSAGKGPTTMREGGAGAIANQETIEFASSEGGEGPAELYEGPQEEND